MNTTVHSFLAIMDRKVPRFRQLTEGLRVRFSRSIYLQFAALCYRLQSDTTDHKPEILLITSRGTGRWIIPKGWGIKKLSASKVAAREAYEEGGIVGAVDEAYCGVYHYNKTFEKKPSKKCRVYVYPLLVEELSDHFPEEGQRHIEWFTPEEAAKRVHEPELQELLRNFIPG